MASESERSKFALGLNEAESQPRRPPKSNTEQLIGDQGTHGLQNKTEDELFEITESQAPPESLGSHGSAGAEPRNPVENVNHSESDGASTKPSVENFPVWKMYLQQAKAHDEELVKVQNSDLDSLLIFAGLFSGILSAFLIEIRKGLQEDLQAKTNDILIGIFQRIDNATAASTPVHISPFQPTAASIWTNALWFLSLTLSLVSAFGTILAKGWIAQYTVNSTSGVPAHDACMRHCRFNGVTQWNLKTTIDCLPLLIHAAFFFFFAGLVVLLAQDNVGIQNIVMVLVVITTSIYLISTFLPMRYPDCPFQTPLSGLIAQSFIKKFIAKSVSTGVDCPAPDTLMANALAWLLVTSTHKDVIWMTVEAIAALPATAEIQVGLSEGNAAGILIQGLSESIQTLRSNLPLGAVVNLHHHVQTYLYAILHLVQTGPCRGTAGCGLCSMIHPGGSLADWRGLGPDTAELALCVKARITLLHCDRDEFKDLFDTDVPMMVQAVSQESHPHIAQMLREIIVLMNNPKVNIEGSQMIRIHHSIAGVHLLQYLQSNESSIRMKGLEILADLEKNDFQYTRVTQVGNINTIISRLKYHDKRTQHTTMEALVKLIENDELRNVVLNADNIEMLLQMAVNSDLSMGLREVWQEIVTHMLKYRDIREKIVGSDILSKVIKDIKDESSYVQMAGLEVLSKLSQYEEMNATILGSWGLVTAITGLKGNAIFFWKPWLRAIAELSNHDDIRMQLMTSYTLEKIISSLTNSDSLIRKTGLQTISELLQFYDIRMKIRQSDIIVTIINHFVDRNPFIQTTVLQAIMELSKHDDIRIHNITDEILTKIIGYFQVVNVHPLVQTGLLQTIHLLSKYDDTRKKLISSNTLIQIVNGLKHHLPSSRITSLKVIAKISQQDDIRTVFKCSDTLITIVNCLKDNDLDVQKSGLLTVMELSKYDDIRLYILNSNALDIIINHLKDKHYFIQTTALQAAIGLSKHSEMRRNLMSHNIQIIIIGYLKHKYTFGQIAGLQAIVELSRYDNIRPQIISDAVLITIINYLNHNCSHIQRASLEALVALSQYDNIRQDIMMSDAFFTIIAHLKSSNSSLQQTVLRALKEFLQYDDIRAWILSSTALSSIVAYSTDSRSFVQIIALEAITEFSQYVDIRTRLLGTFDIIAVVTSCFRDQYVQMAGLQAIIKLSKYEDLRSQIINSNALATVISCLTDGRLNVQKASLETIIALSKNDDLRMALFQIHLMPMLPVMLSNKSTHAQNIAASILSYLGGYDDIRVKVKSSVVPLLLSMLGSKDLDTCIHAAETLAALGLFDSRISLRPDVT